MDAALAAVGAPPVEWVELPMGLTAIPEHGSALPTSTLDALAGTDGWLLGPIDGVAYPEPQRSQLNPSGALRKHFDLYANVRPARAFSAGRAVVPDADLVILRENTEGFYADRNTFAGSGEFMPTADVAVTMGIITRAAVERIAVAAFELARRRRKHLTIVHKANVLRLSMGLFRDVCREVGERYPDVVVDDFHIDAMTVHLVRRGGDFDVLVAENMFGDILSDLTGELAGSLGIAPSLNSSDTAGHGPGRARLRAGHRRPQRRQPDRHDPVRRHAARLAGHPPRGRAPSPRRPARGRGRARDGRRRHQHPGSRRYRHHDQLHRRSGAPHRHALSGRRSTRSRTGTAYEVTEGGWTRSLRAGAGCSRSPARGGRRP